MYTKALKRDCGFLVNMKMTVHIYKGGLEEAMQGFLVHIPYSCTVDKVVGVCLSGVSLNGRFHTCTHSVWERAGCPLHFAKWHFLPLHTPDYALNCCLATIWTGPNCCVVCVVLVF